MPPKRRRQPATASVPKRTRNAYFTRSTRVASEDNSEVETVAQKPATSFLALPKELRDQIYHEIWKTIPPFQVALPWKGYRKEYHAFEIEYDNNCTEAPHQPTTLRKKSIKQPTPWILTSKQVLQEALEQFNRIARWTYVARYDFDKLQDPQLAAWHSPATTRRTTRQNPILLQLRDACSINMPLALTLNELGEIDEHEMPVYRILFDSATTELLQALGSGIAGSRNLKRIRLVLHANAWTNTSDHNPVKANLRLLHSLNPPNLQALHLVVLFNVRFQACAELMAELRQSVTQMGLALVGGKGREVFEELVDGTGRELFPLARWQCTFTRC